MARPEGTGNSEAVPELSERVEAKPIAVAGLPSGQYRHRCLHRRGDFRGRIGGAVYETGGDLIATGMGSYECLLIISLHSKHN